MNNPSIQAAASAGETWFGASRTVTVAVGGSKPMIERTSTGPLARWTYSEIMPVVPALDVGVVPIAQWVVLPLALVYLARRQMAGTAALATAAAAAPLTGP